MIKGILCESGVLSILLQNFEINTPHIFGLPGLVLTQLTVSVPYATFIIAAGLQGVPRHIEETAASMATPSLKIWTDIVLPCVYPHLMIVVHSFGAIWTYELSPRNWTGEHYLQIIKAPSLLKDTLSIALIATPILVTFGLILGHRMYFKKEWRFLNFIMIIPFVLPGVVLAALIIGLIKTVTELSASLIMAPLNWKSLSLGIVYFIEQGQLSRASALSIILVAVIGAGTFAAAYWSQSSRNSFTGDSGDALERLVLGRAPISFPRNRKKRKRNRSTFLRRREPLLVVDDKSGIIEANRVFLHLVGADSLGHLQSETSFSVLFFYDHQVLEIFTSGEAIENRATSMMILNGERVPVILHAYVLTNDSSRTNCP
ncbi:MAG: hypothetical protein PF693_13570 [Spirochaetia bacterium]|nr:hypothetical protein [Spirochaetia bacterium]